MIKAALWLGKMMGLVIWTVVWWISYGLAEWLGQLIIRQSDMLPLSPESIEMMSGLLGFVHSLGLGVMVLIWLLGCGIIFVLGWLARKAAPF